MDLAGKCMFKVNKKTLEQGAEICLKLTIKY